MTPLVGLRPDDLWIMGTATLCSVACGLVGCFLVLRRMSLLGDAISHAILPGLAGAFMLTGDRDPLAMLAGAMIVGVATAFLSAGLNRWGRVPEDAAMGVVFTALFAVGVLLISWVARDVDLDPGCVLYGQIEFVPFDTVTLAWTEVPRAFVVLAAVLAVNAAVILVFFKELKIVAFDPYLATTMGISAALFHYGLMTLVAATSVASFESVGSVLVVAMLVAPGATAHLLTDRLGRLLWIAAGVAAVAAVAGYALALRWNTSVAGMISVIGGVEFLLAALFAPRYGYVGRIVQRLVLALRIDREDVLGMLYRWHERAGVDDRPLTTRDVTAAVAGGISTRLALWSLMRLGLVRRSGAGRGGALGLSSEGMARGRRIVRSHRLWESYLATHLGLPLDHLHEPSHRAEHFITPAMQAELGKEVGAVTDPHGSNIPAVQDPGGSDR